jgi:phage/plasmid-like protein (TIGR03299 family)
MAHNITERDNLFTVREPAWHGIGTVLPEYPTREEAKAIAHPWEPESQPLYRKEITVSADGEIREEFVEIKSHHQITRSDDHSPIGVTTSTTSLVSNEEMYDIAEALQGNASDVKFETGGSISGGAKVWLLLRLNEPLTVKGDPRGESIAYYALQNNHDGNGSFRGQATMTRIVCDNTSLMADLDAEQRGTNFVFRHTSSIKERIEEAKAALQGWRSGILNWNLQMEHLNTVRVNPLQREWFVTTFIPMPQATLVSERVQNNVENARGDLRKILSGVTQEGISDTAYGLVQASIEYSQHYRATRAATAAGRMENLFRRAYLEPSLVTANAVELAEEAALVS